MLRSFTLFHVRNKFKGYFILNLELVLSSKELISIIFQEFSFFIFFLNLNITNITKYFLTYLFSLFVSAAKRYPRRSRSQGI